MITKGHKNVMNDIKYLINVHKSKINDMLIYENTSWQNKLLPLRSEQLNLDDYLYAINIIIATVFI
jgi:hypothetical protein